MTPHPAAGLFPLLAGDDLAELAADIKTHGLLEPITLCDGLVLDGRNRLAACSMAEVEPRFDEYDGDDPVAWVVSKNLHRRHLNESQRGMVASRLATLGRGGDPNTSIDVLGTQAGAADLLNVSVPSVQRARVVLDHGIQPLIDAVDAGDLPVSAAAEVARLPIEEQAAIVSEGPEAVQKAAKRCARARSMKRREDAEEEAEAANNPNETGSAVLLRQTAAELLGSLDACSVDLLLTDPPYTTDVEDIREFAKWVHLALPKIKDSGSAYICTGAYPDELAAYLHELGTQSRLALTNVLVWTYRNTLGASPSDRYKLNWQAIFYLRGPDAGPLRAPLLNERFAVQDIPAPDGRRGERVYQWQKPDELGRRLILHSTDEGALVVDPFAGSGSFLLAAKRLGRHGLGCDVDAAAAAIARERGCDAA
jgi:DNA modification methylase